MRVKLIKKIVNDGFNVKEASFLCGINYFLQQIFIGFIRKKVD